MKKKIVALTLVVAMLAIAVIGGTLAYFTDTEKATNVMTVGKVDIDLEEYMMTDDGKVAFDSETAKTLYPMTDDQGMVQNNKIVDVYNDSTCDAYIRTIVAFEKMGEGDLHYKALANNNASASGTYGVVYDTAKSYWGDVVIDEITYEIHVFDTVDGTKIPAGARVQSLQGVWLDKSVTNEDINTYLGADGKMNILVVAQGVQAENFESYDAAFAATFELTEANIISWFSAADNAVINDHSEH